VPLPPASQETGITSRLRNCIDVLMRAELEVTVVDLTAPAMESLGLRTVKVLVPGAYPMNFDGRFPHFGGKRMRSAPVTAGLRDTPTALDDLCYSVDRHNAFNVGRFVCCIAATSTAALVAARVAAARRSAAHVVSPVR